MKCFKSSIKIYRCKIILLDETELIQEIKETQKGQDLLNIVFKHLDLLETVYFGLRFIDSKGYSNWLEPNKNTIKQVKNIEPIKLYFGVKFYASDPCKLREECTRYQFFLQIKQDIQQQRLPVTNELASQLLAYIIQSELGDYDPKIHQFGYVNEFCWIENQSIEFENKVCDLHKKLIGQIPTVVEMQFLERVKWLDLYGCELHSVIAEDHYEYYIGLSPHGIIVLKNKLKIAYYYWPRIIKIWRKGKYFMIKVIDKNNIEKKYGFELYDKKSTNRLYYSCKNHKEFFKLSQSIRIQHHQQQIQQLQQQQPQQSSSLNNIDADNKTNPTINRPNPSLIRVSSRRFRRIGRPDGSDVNDDVQNNKNEQLYYDSYKKPSNKYLQQQQICRFNSTPSISKHQQNNNNENFVINPYYSNKSESGLFSKSANASPLSVRSAFVSRYDYGHGINYISPIKRNLSSISLQSKHNQQSRGSSNCDNQRLKSKSMSLKNDNFDSDIDSDLDLDNRKRLSKRKYLIRQEQQPTMVEWNETMINNKSKCLTPAPLKQQQQQQHSNAVVVKNLKRVPYDNGIQQQHQQQHFTNQLIEDNRLLKPKQSFNRKKVNEKNYYYYSNPVDDAKYYSQQQNFSKKPYINQYDDNQINYFNANDNEITPVNKPPPPPQYYYFDDKNLNNQNQNNNNNSLNNSSSPRVTFQPTHSTAYYYNKEDHNKKNIMMMMMMNNNSNNGNNNNNNKTKFTTSATKNNVDGLNSMLNDVYYIDNLENDNFNHNIIDNKDFISSMTSSPLKLQQQNNNMGYHQKILKTTTTNEISTEL